MSLDVSPPRAVRGTRRPGDDRVRGLMLVGAMAALMWLVEVMDLVAGDLDAAGIRPRDPDGLSGIVAAPFLVLGAAIALGGLVRVAAVTAIVAVVGGLGTWLTAPENTIHIGASGLVFGFAAYLVARGAYTRGALHLAAGLVVLAVYGTTLLFGFVPTPGVSWQGHLFGAIGGVVAARVLHRSARSVVAS